MSAGPDLSRADRPYRLALGLATLALLLGTWPLWVGSPDFPRVPLVRGLPAPVPELTFALLVAAVAGGVFRRWSMALAAALLVVEVFQDQQRFQPWVYQYVMAAVAFSCCPTSKALGLCRLFTVALYAHSALSKLDVSFFDGLGPAYLPVGWDPAAGSRMAAAMVVGELLVAFGLLGRRTRRLALGAAVGMHAVLIAVFGLWLDHSVSVLLWNAAFIAEDLALFGPDALTPSASVEEHSPLAPAATFVFLLAAILPLGERLGWVDPWPAFAFYAAHVERVEVLVPEGDAERLPREIPRRVVSGDWHDGSQMLELDLTGWSRRARGVPVYPGGRASLGLAEWLIVRYGLEVNAEVRLWGRAHPWTGRRDVEVARGLAGVRRLADRRRLNAHAAP